MLFQVPELDDADNHVLGEIDAMRQRLSHLVANPARWQCPLRRSLVARHLAGSNKIEGYTVSVEHAESVVAGETAGGDAVTAAHLAVAGYHDALTFVQQSATFEAFAYEEMLLAALHFMMLRHELTKGPGRYRTCGIWVTGGSGRPPAFTGPEPDEVPGLMGELVEWLQRGDLDAPVFVRAAIAHLNLVSIHPWRDGNGRMSRCLHTLVLARDRVLAPEFSSIEEWLGMSTMNTAEYYGALSATRAAYNPDNDTHAWVRFCLRAHHLQAQIVDRRVTRTARLWGAMSDLAESRGLHDRMVTALYSASVGHLRRTTYAGDEDLTRDQALRDLNHLVRLDLIEPAGLGRLRHYIAGSALRELVREIRAETEGHPLVEPYRN